MKKFYTQSFWFWVTSKIIFVCLMLISILSILGESKGRLGGAELGINFLAFVEALLLIITVIQDFTSKLNVIKVVSGVLMMLFGIALFGVLLTVSSGGQSAIYMLGYPFSLWMILIGMFDLLRVKRADQKI
ncbi:MAG: hypothetical protein GC193_07425 [Cryomorphaceae bacterium]|nr:hypothetical protein [Cryomorphaceae bacterium]